MKSSLSSLFLFFLAGQFFSPFFGFMISSMFWQNTPPYSETSIPRKGEEFQFYSLKGNRNTDYQPENPDPFHQFSVSIFFSELSYLCLIFAWQIRL